MVAALVFALAAANLAVPADAAAASITTKMLVEAADLSGLAISPDGRWLAYRVVRGSLAEDRVMVDWYVVPTDNHDGPKFLAAGGQVLFNHAGGVENEIPRWAGDSRTLIFRARLGGSVQLWAAKIGEAPRSLTEDAADVLDFNVRSDGRTVEYSVGATRHAIRAAAKKIYDDGMLVDGTTDLAQPVAGGLVIDGERVMQRYTGDWFDRAPLLHETKRVTRSITLPDFATAAPKIDAAFPTVRLTRTAAASTVTVERANEPTLTCPQAACGKAPINAVAIPGSNSLVVGSENSLILDPIDSLGRTRMRVWTLGASGSRLLVDQAGILTGGTAPSTPCPVTATTMYCVAAAAASPPRLIAIDLRTGRQTVIVDPNRALREAITSPVRPLNWSTDQHQYHGELLLPAKTTGPIPVVISYYTSRGFLRGGFGEAFPVQPLLKAGIAVLCIDKSRLAGAYDAERNYDVARLGILAIVDRLAAEKLIDRDRIGMWGFSFGSEVASRMIHRTRLLRAAALASLQITEAYYWANAFPGRNMQEMQRDQFGLDWPDRAPETWARIAPSRTTSTLSAPMLLQLPEDEARWMGEFLTSGLRDGKPIEMHAFADEAHQLMGPRHRRAALERNLDWFRYWLTQTRDKDPAKAEQYARWDKLSAMQAAQALDRPNP